jgi:hypothetical protein
MWTTDAKNWATELGSGPSALMRYGGRDLLVAKFL